MNLSPIKSFIHNSVTIFAAGITIMGFFEDEIRQLTWPNNQFLDKYATQIHVSSTLVLICILCGYIYSYRKKLTQSEQRTAELSRKFHILVHTFRDYNYKILSECDNAIREIGRQQKSDEAIDIFVSNFDDKVSDILKNATVRIADSAKWCMKQHFKYLKLNDTCSVVVYLRDDVLNNMNHGIAKKVKPFLKKESVEFLKKSYVKPVAFDNETYTESIRYLKKRNADIEKVLKFKIEDCTATLTVVTNTRRFIEKNIRKSNAYQCPPDGIETICKANAVLVTPIHTIIRPNIITSKKPNSTTLGFIFILSKNKMFNDVAYHHEEESQSAIFHQISFCSDIVNNLCIFYLVLKEKLMLAAEEQRGLISQNRRSTDRTGTEN